ncbi:MAG: endonuclease [Desulfobulbaceae bacterium]|nr:MAG: endonuclease [Desulfobulbaceae bacterium]
MIEKVRSESANNGKLLRVATYNIHGGLGRDGRRDMSRIAAVINDLRCRVVALQEVLAPHGHGNDALSLLEQQTGMTGIAGITMRSARGQFGNALLCDLPIVRVRKHDLSVHGREKRGALDVLLRRKRRQLRVLATHLGLRPYERRQQVRRLLDIVGKGEQPDEVTIIMGDMNEWFLWGRPLRWIHANFGRAVACRTFPADRPLLALDRIWCHPPEQLTALAPHRSRLSRVASDHLPLVATLAL